MQLILWSLSHYRMYPCRGEHYPDSDWWQYSRTKLMNLMTGKEQARRLAGSGVDVSTGEGLGVFSG